MSRKIDHHDLERTEALGLAFADALKKLPSQSALSARNLVLDFYASETDFIRLFQKKVTPDFSTPIAKSWEWAINADTYWAYRNMSKQVLDQFEDQWKTNSLLIATRIMQSIGNWKKFAPDPSWEARITEHVCIDGMRDKYIQAETSLGSASAHLQIRYPSEHSSQRKDKSHDQQSASPTSKTAANTNRAASTTKSSTTRGLSTLSVMLGLFLIGSILGTWKTQTSGTSPNAGTGESTSQASTNNPLKILESRLVTSKTDLASARLVCELDNLANRFQSLANDANQQGNRLVASQATQGKSEALSRIQRLNQPGKEQYWESCEEGVGFQSYDKYSWTYGGDFKGQLFAVAKKKCISPAIEFNVYADKDLTRKLYSEWVRFTPSTEEGIADNIKVTVPADSLPKNEGSSIWWSYNVSCNHAS
jgi:hypothetical protein